MFANPIWSALLLAAPLALYYFVIRPWARARCPDLFKGPDSFWAAAWAHTKAFREFWVATLGALATALPDILVLVAPLDFSGVLPQPWPAYTSAIFGTVIVLMTAFRNKPGEIK